MNFQQAIEVFAAFQREQVRYILVGSIALAAHGLVRATQDVDFMVSPDPDNVGRIKQALRNVFHDESTEEIATSDLAGPYPVIRYVSPEGDFVIDLIARLGEVFTIEDLEWEEIQLEGVVVRVATPKTLYLMKRDTLRPQVGWTPTISAGSLDWRRKRDGSHQVPGHSESCASPCE